MGTSQKKPEWHILYSEDGRLPSSTRTPVALILGIEDLGLSVHLGSEGWIRAGSAGFMDHRATLGLNNNSRLRDFSLWNALEWFFSESRCLSSLGYSHPTLRDNLRTKLLRGGWFRYTRIFIAQELIPKAVPLSQAFTVIDQADQQSIGRRGWLRYFLLGFSKSDNIYQGDTHLIWKDC